MYDQCSTFQIQCLLCKPKRCRGRAAERGSLKGARVVHSVDYKQAAGRGLVPVARLTKVVLACSLEVEPCAFGIGYTQCSMAVDQ